jgi:hypothetical protein
MELGHSMVSLSLRTLALAALLALSGAQSLSQQASTPAATFNDATEIVRRSLEADDRTAELSRNYTYKRYEVRKHLGRNGEVKSSYTKTWDIINLYGEPYARLIQKNDVPLNEKGEKREEQKLEEFFNGRKNESDAIRQKRLAREKKERDAQRAFFRDVVNAYDFRIAGEEAVDGRDTWVIGATPSKDFHPTQPHAGLLSKLKATVWIDKQEGNWVKAEGEVMETLSAGLFIARLHPGTRFALQQARVNDEIWLVRRLSVEAKARVLLVSNRAVELEYTFFDFKKFAADTKILPATPDTDLK